MKNALKTRIAHQIFAKAMNALHVLPDARHATVRALMTANRVTRTAHIRITSAAFGLAATAMNALKTRIAAQGRYVPATCA